LSKLSKLKQEAYLAGKNRKWDEAISIYERILDIDKNNPTLVNELGDMHLRQGSIPKAIEYFLNAAANYRQTGLLNNAVAIYKKILRHDEQNINAHWYLAEIRASQGLSVEGEVHAAIFLKASEKSPAELKEIFQKRCMKLLSLFPSQRGVLERLQQVFRIWSQPLEEARVACLIACIDFDEGQSESARAQVDKIIASHPDVQKYPEFAAWRRRIDPESAERPYADVNTLQLDNSREDGPQADHAGAHAAGDGPLPESQGAEAAAASASSAGAPRAPEADTMPDGAAARAGYDDLDDLLGSVKNLNIADGVPSADPEIVEKDTEGCYEIDVETAASLDDVFADAQAASTPRASDRSVDLLAEILEEEGPDLVVEEAQQVRTIAHEIGERVGDGEAGEVAERQYEMGMVYLEMGMFDQAIDCFSSATRDPAYALRSFEMWGITLLRCGRVEQAVATFKNGLDLSGANEKEKLGLIYHLGRAHEQAGRLQEARHCYERAEGITPSFLDIAERLAGIAVAS
jgi:tetratricopeptide (TPR) repeat protein